MAAKTPTKSGAKSVAKTTVKTTAAKTPAARKPAKAKAAATAKPATKTASKTAAKAAPKTVAAKPTLSVVKDGQNSAAGRELKKRELLDLVVKRTDVKKKFAKPVMEAMIEVLGEALAEERPLNLQPMGKIMPKRTKEAGTNRVITARIRQSKKTRQNQAEGGAVIRNTPVAKPAK